MTPLGFSQEMASQQIAALLPATAYIFDRATAPSGAGGQKTTFTIRPDPVPCAIGPVGGGERSGRQAPRMDSRTTEVITIPAGTPITVRDEVEVLGRGRYEVTAIPTRSIEIAREVEVMEAA